MKTFRGYAFLCLAIGGSACQTKESVADRCVRVRDQLVELELRADDPKREAHADIMRRAMGNEFLATCARAMTDTQRTCVLSAADANAAMTCTAASNPLPRTSLEARRTK